MIFKGNLSLVTVKVPYRHSTLFKELAVPDNAHRSTVKCIMCLSATNSFFCMLNKLCQCKKIAVSFINKTCVIYFLETNIIAVVVN